MQSFLKRLLYSILLLLLQILLLDRFTLFGYVTPMVCLYLVLILDSNVSPAQRMLWGFCTGLVSDIFVNTPGVQAASLTLLAAVQPALLRMLFTFDRRNIINPGFMSLGAKSYLPYLIIGSLLFNLVACLLRLPTGTDMMTLLSSIGLGTSASFLGMILFELLFRVRRRKRY